jgi:RNA polymerase sigma-70 factor (ECF subfamily)
VDPAERLRLNEALSRLADGDREAFHPAFVCLRPLLLRFAARHLPADEAEDVAQEALLRVFFRASEFDRTRDGLSWAFGIAAWEIRTARRRRQRRREEPLVAVEGKASPGRSPEEAALAGDLADAMDAALLGLRPGDAGALRQYAAGLRPGGVAAPTFRKRVERGLSRLRQVWKGRHGAP